MTPPRATPLPPEERRRAIVKALIPLLVEQGGEVSTKQIAQAAGIAEGTLFRVFENKTALMLAAAQEAINPEEGWAQWEQLLADSTDLRASVREVIDRIRARMQHSMGVMLAVRQHLLEVRRETEHGPPPGRPPGFIIEAQTELHQRLTSLFERHSDELATDPDTAARVLRALIFGSSRGEFGSPRLTSQELTDLCLDGLRRRDP